MSFIIRMMEFGDWWHWDVNFIAGGVNSTSSQDLRVMYNNEVHWNIIFDTGSVLFYV